MIKKVLFIFIFLYSYGSEFKIESKNFEFDNKKLISVFEGDVNVTRGEDNILTDKAVLYLSKKRKLQKMVANGDIKFKISNDGSIYVGQSDNLSYNAIKQLFILSGNVHIKRVDDNQTISANKVIFDKKNGTLKVMGTENKPLKFILKVDE